MKKWKISWALAITYIVLAVLLFFIGGCRAKKDIRTEVRQSDTLIVKREVIKAPVLNQALTIHEICDTITGEVVRFEKVFVVDGDSIRLVTDANNALKLEIKARERVLKEKDSTIDRLRKTSKEVSETIRYRTDWQTLLISIVLAFLVGLIRPWRFFYG